MVALVGLGLGKRLLHGVDDDADEQVEHGEGAHFAVANWDEHATLPG